MLNNTNQLTADQLKDLDYLSTICKKTDVSIPNLYVHVLEQLRALPASLLYYEEKQLVGFLGTYFFYDDAVEVSLLVHPRYRRRGIGKQLIKSILPLIESQNYHQVIFSNPAQRNNTWLEKEGLSYLHREYYMERSDINPIFEYKQDITFRNATAEDIPLMCGFDEACFPARHSDTIDRFQHLIDGREYQIIIAYQKNNPIGKAHIRWQSHAATLSDIAVFPDQQGKGLGTALIAHCINLALSEGKTLINLDVETHNERALKLYTRLGFQIKNACDYWKIKIDQLVNKN